jgi:hypothetical protein
MRTTESVEQQHHVVATFPAAGGVIVKHQQVTIIETQVPLQRAVHARLAGEQRCSNGLQVGASQPAGRYEIGNPGQRTSWGELFVSGQWPLDTDRRCGRGTVQSANIRHGFYRVSGNRMAFEIWRLVDVRI